MCDDRSQSSTACAMSCGDDLAGELSLLLIEPVSIFTSQELELML
jgi:hypothetical protein